MFNLNPKANNEKVFMTRRYPDLKKKQLKRDSKIIKKLIPIWDIEQDKEKYLQTFLKYKDKLSPERYWEVLRSVWIISGSVEHADTFRELFTADKRSRHYFSTPEEIEYVDNLPENIEVFRAADKMDDTALAWTLSEEYAEWYKKAFLKEEIFRMNVPKSQIFAYINRNQEQEIIIL